MVRRVLAPLAAIVVLAGAALAAVAVAGGPPPREVAVIVELEGPPALRADAARTRAAQGASARQRAAVRDAARAAGLHVRERSTYSLTFNGLAVTVPEDERAQLANLPGVAAVHPDRRMRASLGVSVPLVGAPRVWALQDAGGRPVTGTGVDVAVIDTGVDDTHPALDGGTVVGGHDFVNDDADPMDDNGHGTQVAGIVAAGGEPTGVAPAASIVAYKVLVGDGYGDSSDVLAALEAAVDPANPHRAEVVNFSLGSGEPADGPVTSAAQAAAEAGVVVVASAGNAGPAEQSVGAPAQAPGVLAVGASISGLEVPVVRMTAPRALDLRTTRWEFSANPPDQEQEVEVVDVGEGDFAAHDVRGKAVLLDAPGPPLQQALEAERRGAVALLIRAGSAGGPVSAAGERLHEFPTGSGDDGRFDSLVAVIVDDDGVAALRQALGAGPVRVEIAGEDATDQIAAFSSRGPTATFAAKPDLVAPGVEIRSTVPKALHAPGVARFSGTSMSAPHVAGAAALVRQLHPDWPASAVRSALAGASTPLEGPPLLSGAGRLDVAAAARAAVVADATALSFGLAGTEGRTERTRVLALSNVDDETADVRIAAHAAAGAGAPVTVSPASARLAPGEQVEVTVRLAADSPAADVQGWVDVDVAGPAPDLRLPYALPVRALQVVVSPDPADDRTEAFVATPVDLDGPPVVEVRGPDGIVTRVTARHDHDQWWRAVLEGGVEGVYRVHATGRALSSLGGATLSGATTFEVAEPDQEDGSPLTWKPVGPNSIGGELDLGPGADPHTYVLDPNNPMVWVSADGAATWRARRLTTVTSGVPVELVPDARRAGTLFLAVNSTAEEPTFEGAVLR
ncbi:MAG TPA: S8 family serine peptidase, partial [Solirubrobacteraceae bacterium]|nr:S8 family serine peptidase [Solirubrobacteraceae bacterium]